MYAHVLYFLLTSLLFFSRSVPLSPSPPSPHLFPSFSLALFPSSPFSRALSVFLSLFFYNSTCVSLFLSFSGVRARALSLSLPFSLSRYLPSVSLSLSLSISPGNCMVKCVQGGDFYRGSERSRTPSSDLSQACMYVCMYVCMYACLW